MDGELRRAIYEAFASTGKPPRDDDLDQVTGSREATEAALQRLHDDHVIVLGGEGDIRMALPFSAVPTGYTVVAGAISYEANCAWDALAVPVALGRDATIDARWMDTREPVGLRVTDGSLSSEDGFVHVVVPARHWWDDIAYT